MSRHHDRLPPVPAMCPGSTRAVEQGGTALQNKQECPFSRARGGYRCQERGHGVGGLGTLVLTSRRCCARALLYIAAHSCTHVGLTFQFQTNPNRLFRDNNSAVRHSG